jgi:hypothetical protein
MRFLIEKLKKAKKLAPGHQQSTHCISENRRWIAKDRNHDVIMTFISRKGASGSADRGVTCFRAGPDRSEPRFGIH